MPEPRLRRQAAYSACERMNRHRALIRGPPHTVMWGQDSDPGKEILLRVPSLTDIRYWLLFVQWAVVCRAEDVVDCNTIVR